MNIYYFLGHEQYQPEELVEHAVLAEKAGFDGVFVSEHFNPWVADVGAAGFAFATLGAIVSKTEKVKIMTGVVTPLFRFHPAVIAQASATIDRLSKGRFELGVGTGEKINEAPLGYNFPDYKERSERMREALEIMKKLLQGQKITFAGKYYQVKNAKLHSPPISDVSILLAAGGPKSASLAAEFADGVITSVKDVMGTKTKIIDPVFKKAKELDRKTPRIVATRWSVFAKDSDEAYKALRPWRGLRAPSRSETDDPKDLQKEADALPKEQILERYSMVSSAKDFIRVYKPLTQNLQADSIVIQTTAINQKALIELLGKEVIGELKKP